MNSLIKVARSGVRIPIILNNVTPQYESIRGWRRLPSGSKNDPPDNIRYYDVSFIFVIKQNCIILNLEE